MFNGLRVFHHRSTMSTEVPVADVSDGGDVSEYGLQRPSHVWPRHPLEERRSKKRDECFRGLMELEAELLQEVEREV